MLVIKRDGSKEQFDLEKVKLAVSKAFESTGSKINDAVFDRLEKYFNQKLDQNQEETDVDKIHNLVEQFLMKYNYYNVSKEYILNRYQKALERAEDKRLIKEISEKLGAINVANQNANLDEKSFGGRVGEASRCVTKDFALKYCMSKKSRQNHLNNEIYTHDLDSYSIGMHNCLSIPFDDLLSKGFNTRQVDIRPARSINTAFQLVAVIFQIQSLQQFGGVSATHLDWTMVPYVRRSFFKHYLLQYLKQSEEFDKINVLTMSNEELDDWIDENKENYLKKWNLKFEDFTLENKNTLDPQLRKSAIFDTRIELYQAVEGMYHNLNSLQSRSGNQLPFTSINYGTCTLPEGQLVTQALLEGSLKGVGKFHKTPIFPCGIFQHMNGVNDKPGTPNYYLYRLALKSTAKRLYPNYANVDWSGNAGYDVNDPRTYFSTMGCHAINTPIIMSDGTQKMVQDIIVVDSVMGADGTPRKVLSLIRGNDKLFKVEQGRGESYIVNEGHILALKYSVNSKYKNFKKGDKVNMSVHDFLKLPNYAKKYFKGYKGSFDLPEKQFNIPPYILGLWLGDGYSRGTRFSVNVEESQLLKDLEGYAKSINKNLVVKQDKDKCFIVDITNSKKRNEGNKFRQALINYNLIQNKHIPECYFYGSKGQRKELLAGLINTDGWARKGRRSVCFGNTNLELIKGAKRLADSLGYTTNIILARDKTIRTGICKGSILKPYYHLSIYEFDDKLLMDHKRTNVTSTPRRDYNTSTLKITEVGDGDFYGFELDGDRLYLFNDCTVTHNCRTANGYDINAEPGQNPQLKDGRGNICPVTIILPTLAMEAGRDTEKFMRLLGRKISEAKDALIERFDWICSQSPESAKFMYENGTMFGYKPEEGIRSALKHGTLAIGQLGLAETLYLLIGTDQTTPEGMKLAKRIESLFKKRCAEYKEEYKLNFGVYYTPAENLCYTALKKFRTKYGVIEHVSDKDFFTNSIHVPVWKDVDPFEKIDIESQLTGYSSAGCITYVELPSTVEHNLDALETIVNYAMDHDIPYFACNVPNDTCNSCGASGEFGEECPECGGTNISRLRRVTGYLSGDYKTAFNLGKQDEVEKRVKHIKN